MNKETTLFFDWDGTLADSMPLCIRECEVALEKIGLPPLPPRELMKCNGPTIDEAPAVLGLPPAYHAAFCRYRREAEMTLVDELQRLFPGVEAMVRALSKRARLAIVSNGAKDYLFRSLKLTRLEGCFEQVTWCVSGRDKSEALRQTMSEMGAGRALMIGDRAGDMLAGKANGLPTLAACFGYGSPEEWAQFDYQAYSVDRLQELCERFIAQGERE